MPYIKKEERKVFDECLYELGNTIYDEGQLNYCITRLCHLYLEREGLCYKNINKLIGVLECAKLELYNRIANPYEAIKAMENSDVSTLRVDLLKKLRKTLCRNTVTRRSDGSKTGDSC